MVGTGNINLAAMKKTLLTAGFKGVYIIEYEGEPEDPVKPLTACVESIKKVLF